MSYRKTVLLRRILLYFAKPADIKKYDQIEGHNKGAATHYALRLVEQYFERKNKPYLAEEERETGVKINYFNEK